MHVESRELRTITENEFSKMTYMRLPKSEESMEKEELSERQLNMNDKNEVRNKTFPCTN